MFCFNACINFNIILAYNSYKIIIPISCNYRKPINVAP